MCCDPFNCDAWWFVDCDGVGALGATLSAEKSALSGRGSRGPPSRERETWILVSLVVRFMRAVRRGGGVGIMVGDLGCWIYFVFSSFMVREKDQGLGGGISQRFIVSSDVVSSGIIPCAERARTRCFM